MYALGIDLGTTYTAAATWRNGHAETVSLGSRAAAIPSVVLLREDETFLTGESASRRGLTQPDRLAREFKRRMGDTTPILLGGTPYSAEALMARLLRSVVAIVVEREGGAPSAICVSHPANWGPYKTDLLLQAVRMAGLEEPVSFTTEPEAAAIYYAQQQRIEPGAVVAVYDLGGGTFDAAVLRKTASGFEILGRPEGIERLGGIDFDAAVFAHVARALGGQLEELDEDDPAALAAVARLKEECVAAKEALSADTDVSIPVLLPNVTTEVRLTRAELEAMVRPALYETIEALKRALRSANVAVEDLHSVLLVGGSSRMPIVAQLVGAELGRPVAVDAHPKHAVALGAAWLASGQTAPAPVPRAVGTAPAGEAAAAGAVTASVVAPPSTTPGPSSAPAAGPGGPGTPRGPVTPGGQPTPARQPVQPAAAAGGHVVAAAPVPSAAAPPTPVSSAPVPPAPVVSGTPPTPRVPSVPPPHVPVTVPPPPGLYGGNVSPRPAKRWMPLVAGAAVLVVLVGGGVAVAMKLAGGDQRTSGHGTSSPSATQTEPAPTTTAPTLPPDEQCTEEIKANPRWVCLTSATISNGELRIEYEFDDNGVPFNVNGGYHLHIYGANEDGSDPPDHRMGTQSSNPGRWFVEDKNPSVHPAGSSQFNAVASSPKVCARIAQGQHRLVRDMSGNGTYKTGNCVPLRKF